MVHCIPHCCLTKNRTKKKNNNKITPITHENDCEVHCKYINYLRIILVSREIIVFVFLKKKKNTNKHISNNHAVYRHVCYCCGIHAVYRHVCYCCGIHAVYRHVCYCCGIHAVYRHVCYCFYCAMFY